MNQLGAAALALVVESILGYPQMLQRRFGHPVEWMGWLITFLDDGLNDPEADSSQARLNGILALAALVATCALPAIILQWFLWKLPLGWVINVLIATPFIAQHSLRQHVEAVMQAMPASLDAARAEVSKIVGRDPSNLDNGGIAKAALESLAENASDGVVAPFFWYALLGLPGLVAYKAINTADSMIGHKSEKYLHFGWAAARLDDLVNMPASRLTGAILVLAARVNGKEAMVAGWRAMLRHAGKHNSPNAGWPEAAMAGALGLSFGGPRNYQGELVQLPTMGNGRQPRDAKDISDGLELFRNAMLLLLLISAAAAFVL